MNKSFKRGEVYWVDLNPTNGSEISKIRPCVLIGANPINQGRKTVIAIPLSSSTAIYPPLTIHIPSQNSIAVLDQIRALDKNRFKGLIGTLTSTELTAIEEGLKHILGLPQ